MKIVSIVPSLTELVCDLGLEKELVGRTKFCTHPKQSVKFIPKIGGTKNVNISAVTNLKPDLILANKEENTKEDIEALEKIASVHITDISNYSEALNAIHKIGLLTNRQEEAKTLVSKINSSFSKMNHPGASGRGITPAKLYSEITFPTQASGNSFRLTEYSDPIRSVCYLIWKDPLMTVGNDTYIHDMLGKCGFENVFAKEDRYPKISEAKIKENNPEFIFLSSEPFPFKDKHIIEFSEMFPKSKVVLVDGEYFSWYGSRMVLAADYFLGLLKELKKDSPLSPQKFI